MKLLPVFACSLLCAACATAPGPLNPRSSHASEKPEVAAQAKAASEQPEPASEIASGSAARPQSALSVGELLRLAAAKPPAGALPVLKDGTPMHVAFDPGGNGVPNVAILEVAATGRAETDFAALSRLSRLFGQVAELPSFYLAVYGQESGRAKLLEKIALGAKPVLEALRIFPLEVGKRAASGKSPRSDGSPSGAGAARPPLAVVASFQSHDGEEQEWTVFSNGYGYSRLSLVNTATMHSVVRDINGDGILDVLVFHTGVEAGLGYETLITWYRLAQGAYTEYKSTNIVRNLKAFLSAARRLLVGSDWHGFLREAVAPDILARLRSKYGSDQAIVAELFRSISNAGSGAGGPAFAYFGPDRSIEEAVFPDIHESPFSDLDRSWSFSMTVRITCCDGESRFFSTTVSMMPNPFGPREFSFTTD